MQFDSEIFRWENKHFSCIFVFASYIFIFSCDFLIKNTNVIFLDGEFSVWYYPEESHLNSWKKKKKKKWKM